MKKARFPDDYHVSTYMGRNCEREVANCDFTRLNDEIV